MKSSHYRWVIVFAGGLMGCVAAGVMFSLAVFLEPIARQTGWSHAAISSAMTLNFIVMGLGSFMWGAASDRFGTRIVVLIGSVLARCFRRQLVRRPTAVHPVGQFERAVPEV